MNPLLATDYGNFYAFFVGVPALFFTITAGAIGLIAKFRPLALVSGVLCLMIAVWFLNSLKAANPADVGATVAAAMISGMGGLVMLLWRRNRS